MTISITNLISVHDELDAMFLDHQRALLHLDRDKALNALDRYEHALLRHMKDEEDVLLPIYSERCDYPAVGAPNLYLDEHEKMRAHVGVLKNATAALADTADIEKDVLGLLRHEAFYLRLCGHHDKREVEYLYPLLDAILTDAEKSEMLGRIWSGSHEILAVNV